MWTYKSASKSKIFQENRPTRGPQLDEYAELQGTSSNIGRRLLRITARTDKQNKLCKTFAEHQVLRGPFVPEAEIMRVTA